MGKVTIKTAGSFKTSEVTFTAQDGGHAAALTRAIRFLNASMMEAIELDHKLQSEGQMPGSGSFGDYSSKLS